MEDKLANIQFKVDNLEKEAKKQQFELRNVRERELALKQEVSAKSVDEQQSDNLKQQKHIEGLEKHINFLTKRIEGFRDKIKEFDIVSGQLAVCRCKLAEYEAKFAHAEPASANWQEEKHQFEYRLSQLVQDNYIAEKTMREKNEEIAALKRQIKEMQDAAAQAVPAPMKPPRMTLQAGPKFRCWDRLYEDATARATRLKQLQDNFKEQKQQDVESALKLAEEAMRDYGILLEGIVREEEMRWRQRNISSRDIPSRDAAMRASFREHSIPRWTWEKERGWVCITLPSEVLQSTLPRKFLDATQCVPEAICTGPNPKPVRRLLPFTRPDSNFAARAPQLGSARESRRTEDVQLPSLTSQRHEEFVDDLR